MPFLYPGETNDLNATSQGKDKFCQKKQQPKTFFAEFSQKYHVLSYP